MLGAVASSGTLSSRGASGTTGTITKPKQGREVPPPLNAEHTEHIDTKDNTQSESRTHTRKARHGANTRTATDCNICNQAKKRYFFTLPERGGEIGLSYIILRKEKKAGKKG